MFIERLRSYTAAKRSKLFFEFISQRHCKPVRILDIGGTVSFWKRLGVKPEHNFFITLLNNHHMDKTDVGYKGDIPYISEIIRDATQLTLNDLDGFDVIVSNSMIEHLSNFKDQKKLCGLIERSGKPFFIQAPNKFSIVDPHFPHPLVPFFACYPKGLQAWLLTLHGFGSGSKSPDPESARRRFQYYTPISRKTFRRLFPTGKLIVERHLGIPMSLVMIQHVSSGD